MPKTQPDRPYKPELACPECGGTTLRIAATVLADVDGFDLQADANGDVEWTEDSYVTCDSQLGDTYETCNWDGIVADLVKGD
jgi:hypothetical protein